MEYRKDNVDLFGNLMYQFGEQAAAVTFDSNQISDISALLFTFEAGLTLPGSANARLALGVDYASGDDDSSDDNVNTFDNLYYTGHKFRGYMDYFVSSNMSGLMDLMARSRLDLGKSWEFRGDLHFFQTAADYVDPTASTPGETTRDVGWELDVTFTQPMILGARLDIGGSMFFPSEAYAGVSDPETGLWGYSMITVDF
jgi:hypothetical protein